MKRLRLSIVCGLLLAGGAVAAMAQAFMLEKTARPAPTAAALTAMAADPGSDLSALATDDLASVAAIDAQAYYTAHPRPYAFADYPLGEKRARAHNLTGRAVERYGVVFFGTLNMISN